MPALHWLGAAQTARDFATRKLSPVDLVQALLDRMSVRAYTLDALLKTGNPAHPHPPGRPLPMLGPKVFLA